MVLELEIGEVAESEYRQLGQLMVHAYSGPDGFPTPEEQPEYYSKL